VSLSTLYLHLRYRRHTFGPGFTGPWRLRIRGPGRVSFGKDVQVRNTSGHTALLTFGAEARIDIGDRVEIDGAGLMSASILGPCLLVDTDFHAVGRERRQGSEAVARRPIRIGRNAWIQGKSTILKGVSVGEGAVVRWGALVAADVAPGAVVMGNPAVAVTQP
jgi:acetyltransferase-like isoleucine patch superfamily enzyme